MSSKQKNANEAIQHHLIHFLDENVFNLFNICCQGGCEEARLPHIGNAFTIQQICVDLLLYTQCALIKIRKSILTLIVQWQ